MNRLPPFVYPLLCILLAALLFSLGSGVASARDQCCSVVCDAAPDPQFPGIETGSTATVCYQWNTFGSWAATKCATIALTRGCRAQSSQGSCSGLASCAGAPLQVSKSAEGAGQECHADKNSDDCPGSTRCAEPVFKKNHCVVPCETDSDCTLSGEKCKKPFGAKFRRCK